MPFSRSEYLRSCVFYVLLIVAGAHTCQATSISSTSGSVIYLDTAGNVQPNLLGDYVSFNVTNDTGAAIADAWVTIGNFTGAFVSLAPNENGIVHLGPMAAGATRTVFFYLTVNCSGFSAGQCTIATPQSFSVNLYSGPPATNLVGAQTFSVTVLDTTAAQANKVTTVVTSSSNPVLGTIVTLTITGNTGTIGSANVFYHSPATYVNWPASSFRLYSTSITFSGNNSGTYNNQLLVPTSAFTSSGATDYTIVATFLVSGTTLTPTTVSPVSFISSGTQIKHTDTSSATYTSFPPIGTTSNQLTLSKLTSASTLPTGGITTYTLRATNASSSSSSLDNFVDTLPSTPAAVSYVAGSSKLNGSPIADPTISGNTLTWTNLFAVPAGGTTDLTFQASVPSTAGTYTNSAVGHIGSVQIDTTLSTADNAPATVNLNVGVADLTVSKSHTGNFTQGQTGAAYSIIVSNSGNGPTSGTVTVTDTLPSGLTATAISGTGWSCTLATLTCTRSDALSAAASYPVISLTVNVAGNAAASLTNSVSVSGGGETNTANDSASDLTTITQQSPDLTVTQSQPGIIPAGGTGTILISVSNIGNASTSGQITVTDTLPPGITLQNASGPGWTCTTSGQTLTCTRADVLSPGASYPPITATVLASNVSASLANTVTVSGGGESNIANDSASLPLALAVLVRPDQLLIKKVVDRSFLDTGDVPLYTIQITNTATVAVDNAEIHDHLPNGFQFLPGSARIMSNAGNSQPITPILNGNDLVFAIGHLPANANVLLTYRVRIGANAAPGENTNTAVLMVLSTGIPVSSAQARATVNVGAGLMSTRQIIVGRVFEDVNGNGIFDHGDRPVPGVRIYLSNGQSVITDSAGLYNIPSLRQGSVVLSLDPVTLPSGLGLSDAGRRDGESWTRLLRTPLSGGAMLRQNFALRRLNPAQDSPKAALDSHPEAPAGPANHEPLEIAAGVSAGAKSEASSAEPRIARPAASTGANRRHLEISAERDTIPADGRSSTLLHIRAVDEQGKPLKVDRVLVRTSGGQFALEETQRVAMDSRNGSARSQAGPGSQFLIQQAPTPMPSASGLAGTMADAADGAFANRTSAGAQEALVPVTNGQAVVRLMAGNTPGTFKIEAEAADSPQPLTGQTELYFSPEQRSALLVAVGEVAIGRAAPDFNVTGQSGDFSRRADLFFRKSILGNNLLTFGYASDSSLNGAGGINRMFQLDPLDRVYPVVGDSSTRYEAAQANSRVYGRLDHNRSYLLFGDLRGDTAHSDNTNVSDFGRNLTGLQLHLEDNHKNQVTVAGARPQTSFARDVFPGDMFGLIHLSHIQVLPGSETITLETRDRRNPEVLVSREPLVRSVDYTLDWNTGSIFFLRSVSALDQSLNLLQLVVTYEYQNSGLSSAVYSAQGSRRFDSVGLRLATSFLTQRDDGIGSYYLSNMELEQALPKHGKFHVELPVSHGTVLTAGSFFGSTDASSNADGMAVRATLDQPFGWWKGSARFGFSRTDAGFSNPFGATTLPGSQILRSSVELSPLRGSKLQLGFTDERNDTSLVNNQRQTASVQWKQALGEKMDFTAGYDFRNFEDALNPRQITSDLVSAGLDWRMTSRFQASVRREQNFTDADPTYPNQTLISARYQVNEATRLFLTQRFASAPIVPIGDLSRSGFTALNSSQETSIGVETRWRQYTSFNSRYQLENGINGTDSFAVLGLVTRIPINTHFFTDLGMERGELVSGNGHSFDSGRVGLGWLPNDRFRGTVRYELRDQGGLGQIISLGSAGKISDAVTVLGQFQHSYSSFAASATLNTLNNTTQGTAALAFRPLKSDRAGLLFSYTLRQMQIAGVPNSQNDNVGLLSTDGYFQAARSLEFYGKVAVSDRTARIDSGADISTMTYLFQGRTQVRLGRSFDAAAEARMLRQPVTDTQRWSLGNEVGYWVIPDLRLALGYNYKSIDEYQANFLSNPVRRGVYFVISTKMSHLFDLFGTPAGNLVKGK